MTRIIYKAASLDVADLPVDTDCELVVEIPDEWAMDSDAIHRFKLLGLPQASVRYNGRLYCPEKLPSKARALLQTDIRAVLAAHTAMGGLKSQGLEEDVLTWLVQISSRQARLAVRDVASNKKSRISGGGVRAKNEAQRKQPYWDAWEEAIAAAALAALKDGKYNKETERWRRHALSKVMSDAARWMEANKPDAYRKTNHLPPESVAKKALDKQVLAFHNKSN
jgi:hypothetical protein